MRGGGAAWECTTQRIGALFSSALLLLAATLSAPPPAPPLQLPVPQRHRAAPNQLHGASQRVGCVAVLMWGVCDRRTDTSPHPSHQLRARPPPPPAFISLAGLAVRYYYTIRELSARAVEVFAFLAQQGEIFVAQDPYTIVQPGYAHAWNTHGGSAWLHQHAGGDYGYGACWQQELSNGEWDPSMCSVGVSRLFNYYVEGLYWGMRHAPSMNGNYYDGAWGVDGRALSDGLGGKGRGC